MNLQQLVPILKNGYSYNINNGINTPELVHRPPNTHMLQAARAIEELVAGIQQRDIVIQSLHNQVQGLLNDLEAAQTVQKANDENPAAK